MISRSVRRMGAYQGRVLDDATILDVDDVEFDSDGTDSTMDNMVRVNGNVSPDTPLDGQGEGGTDESASFGVGCDDEEDGGEEDRGATKQAAVTSTPIVDAEELVTAPLVVCISNP